MHPGRHHTLKHLRVLAAERLRPLVLLVDTHMRLQDYFGDVDYFGYADLTVGADICEQLPVLYGLDLREPLHLPFVETATGVSANLHTRSQPTGYEIILLDAQPDHDRQQEIQQIANDVRILNYRERQLSEQLREARAEAEQANQLKSRFISGMSHEFRTPLTAILGYADRLQQQLVSGEPQHQVDAVQRSASHLLSLVNDILDQGQLDTGELVMQVRPIHLEEIAADLAALFAELCANKGLEFSLDCTELPDQVELDGTRLRQIAVNLIGNAIKFTETGSVSIHFQWYDDQLSLRVTDTGPGISEADQAKIFLAFQRLDQHQDIAGTGLGLAISQQLAERMGGSVNLSSSLGVGSTFELKLPAPVVEVAQTAEPDAVIHLDDVKILLVEDDEFVAELLMLYLTDVQAQVQHVDTVPKAMQALASMDFDVVISDMNLPGGRGTDIIRQARTDGFAGCCLLLTASPSAQDKEEAQEAGCDGYLLKPVEWETLIKTIYQHLPKLSENHHAQLPSPGTPG